MTKEELAQIELTWAEKYETLAQHASDAQSQAEWRQEAQRAREEAARLMEEAQP